MNFQRLLQRIEGKKRADYISSLHSSKTLEDFLEFFGEVVYENLKDYLRMSEN